MQGPARTLCNSLLLTDDVVEIMVGIVRNLFKMVRLKGSFDNDKGLLGKVLPSKHFSQQGRISGDDY